MVGYLTKRVPAIAAKIGIITGSIMYIISQFIVGPSKVEAALEAAKASGITDPTALRLVEADAYPHFLHVMAILFIANILLMLIIGKFFPKKEAYVQEYTEQVDIKPWKHVKLAGGIITLVVISIYIYFAK